MKIESKILSLGLRIFNHESTYQNVCLQTLTFYAGNIKVLDNRKDGVFSLSENSSSPIIDIFIQEQKTNLITEDEILKILSNKTYSQLMRNSKSVILKNIAYFRTNILMNDEFKVIFDLTKKYIVSGNFYCALK